jgi:hypothetical protein
MHNEDNVDDAEPAIAVITGPVGWFSNNVAEPVQQGYDQN